MDLLPSAPSTVILSVTLPAVLLSIATFVVVGILVTANVVVLVDGKIIYLALGSSDVLLPV
jgi:hypothetical protein